MRLLIEAEEAVVGKHVKAMITDLKGKFDLSDQKRFIIFLRAITLLSFSPSVFMPLPSQVQGHEPSYGF